MLLLSFLNLILVYKIVYHYYKSYFISFLACLILSSNSLFLGLVHEYFVEMPQLFSVTLLYYFITKNKSMASIYSRVKYNFCNMLWVDC